MPYSEDARQLLQRLRGERGWSRDKLAEESKVSKPTIDRFERGEQDTTLGTLEKLLTAMDGGDRVQFVIDRPTAAVAETPVSPYNGDRWPDGDPRDDMDRLVEVVLQNARASEENARATRDLAEAVKRSRKP